MMKYTFSWSIENYSFCWHKNGEVLVSPKFTVEGMEGTAWTFELYPRGKFEENKGRISLLLMREYDDGPESFSFESDLSICKENGDTLLWSESAGVLVMRKGRGFGKPSFVDIDDVLVRRKSEYLRNDTLNVRCNMWWGEGKIQRMGQTCARTRIAVKKISFIHLVEGFSSLEPNHSSTVKIGYHTTEGCIISSNLYCIGDSCSEENIMFEITSSGIKFLSKCLVSFLDGFGLKIPCGQANNQIHRSVKLPLSLTRKAIMNRKRKYLTDDKLSLKCELIFSMGLEFETIEEVAYEKPAVAYEIPREFISKYKASAELSECSGALDEVKKLKVVCLKFLEDNLDASTASELLLLADTHCDSHLKKIAEDFIFQHDAEVFSSDVWEDFIDENPQLALETMHLMNKRKKEVN
ncbi:hypothetical protein AVEN_233068-1 [Araneus ventricosus]|uniref:MATH domain-containing protein n=1 Tax=Araneus ventricosus TaxID=182803 RepID=A0A4Y2Q7E1_ARAVE|nr:hypothetical protein AVEN_233068-1 [Araneus ventricosus]